MRPSNRYLTQAERETHAFRTIEEGLFTSYGTLASLLPRDMQDPTVANDIIEGALRRQLSIV